MGTETEKTSGRPGPDMAIQQTPLIPAKIRTHWKTSVRITPWKPLATV